MGGYSRRAEEKGGFTVGGRGEEEEEEEEEWDGWTDGWPSD